LSSDCALVHSQSITFCGAEQQLCHAFAAFEQTLGPDNTTMLAITNANAKLMAAKGYFQHELAGHAPKMMYSNVDRPVATEDNQLKSRT
jgi:hypothetical protein